MDGRALPPAHEIRLADLTSGLLSLAAGVAGLAALALPHAPRTHLGWELAVLGFAAAWGAIALGLAARSIALGFAVRVASLASVIPAAVLALWASGGASSFLEPLPLFTALYVAWFFPAGVAWPMIGAIALSYATPLLYDDRSAHLGYPSRALTLVVAAAGLCVAVQLLKRRLLRAEARQRRMAEHDPLTGLPNRRCFDAALAQAAEQPRAALVLFDFNGFKAINDTYGHPAGDAVLCAVARACGDAVRAGDLLARIGGDEFALLAPHAGGEGAERIVATLRGAFASAELPPGLEAVTATFAWALAPNDATEPDELLRCADRRLLELKRKRRVAR